MDTDKNIPKMTTTGFYVKNETKPEENKQEQRRSTDDAKPAEKKKEAFSWSKARQSSKAGKTEQKKEAKPGRAFQFSWGNVAKKSEDMKNALLGADKPVRRALPPIIKGLAVIAGVAAIMLVIKGVDNPVTNTLEDGIQSALGTTLSPDEDIGKLKFVFNDGGQTAQYVYRSSLEVPVDGTLAAGDVMGHPGTVFVAESGAIVRAAAPGMITATGVDAELGRYVRISHPSGLETVYFGLQEITAGGYVERLQEIGKMADDKLYFEVYQDGRLIDPMPYFEGE